MSDWTICRYDDEGNLLATEQGSSAGIDSGTLQWHADRLQRMSGTLQLPLKVALEGVEAELSYEIYNESTAAYVLYYSGEEAVAATLIISGRENEGEAAVLSLFRYLLLEEEMEVEATDERINELLASEQFDFEAEESRPAAYSVLLVKNAGDLQQVIHDLEHEVVAAYLGTVE